MERDKVEAIISNHEKLLQKVRAICDGPWPPGYDHLMDDGWVKFTVEGDNLVVSCAAADSVYDCPTIHTKEVGFPLKLLTMSDSELLAWKEEERRKEKARVDAMTIANRQAQQIAQYNEYLRLKRLYG